MQNILIISGGLSKIDISNILDIDADYVKIHIVYGGNEVMHYADNARCLGTYQRITDYTKFDELYSVVKSLHVIWHFSDIVALGEGDVMRAAKLRTLLQVRGGSPAHSLIYRDKAAQRERLHSSGISVPRYSEVLAPVDVSSFFDRATSSAAILKLRRGAGSQHVYRVDGATQALAVFESMRGVANRNGGCLIEEFIPGRKFHVDGIITGRRLGFCSVSEYIFKPIFFSKFLPGGSITLPDNSDEAFSLKVLAVKALKVMPRIGNCVFHLDIYRDKVGRLLLGEIACRPAGGRILDMIARSFGTRIDVEHIQSLVALDRPAQMGSHKQIVQHQTSIVAQVAIRRRPFCRDGLPEIDFGNNILDLKRYSNMKANVVPRYSGDNSFSFLVEGCDFNSVKAAAVAAARSYQAAYRSFKSS